MVASWVFCLSVLYHYYEHRILLQEVEAPGFRGACPKTPMASSIPKVLLRNTRSNHTVLTLFLAWSVLCLYMGQIRLLASDDRLPFNVN